MARIDKYDSEVSGFRAPLNAAYTGAAAPIGVGINSSGRVVVGAGQTGIVGVVCSPYNKDAGSPIDVITNAELVEFGGAAGTVYTANTTTGVISTAAASASQIKIGHTVEADRLVVRVGEAGAIFANAVVGDQTAITPLTGAFGSTGSAIVDVTASPTQTTVNNNFRALEDKVNLIISTLQTAGLTL